MRILILILLFTTCSSVLASAQGNTKRLPFILLIDNDVPDPSVINGIFLVKDSLGMLKDSIKFDYQVGGLDMNLSEYDKFFHIKQIYNIFIKFKRFETDYIYQIRIPNKYLNGEYPNGFINEKYFVVKIFNKSNIDNQSKYYFKKDENYIYQIMIPGFSTLIPYLKKE